MLSAHSFQPGLCDQCGNFRRCFRDGKGEGPLLCACESVQWHLQAGSLLLRFEETGLTQADKDRIKALLDWIPTK